MLFKYLPSKSVNKQKRWYIKNNNQKKKNKQTCELTNITVATAGVPARFLQFLNSLEEFVSEQEHCYEEKTKQKNHGGQNIVANLPDLCRGEWLTKRVSSYDPK